MCVAPLGNLACVGEGAGGINSSTFNSSTIRGKDTQSLFYLGAHGLWTVRAQDTCAERLNT